MGPPPFSIMLCPASLHIALEQYLIRDQPRPPVSGTAEEKIGVFFQSSMIFYRQKVSLRQSEHRPEPRSFPPQQRERYRRFLSNHLPILDITLTPS